MCFDRPVIVETYGYAETADSHGGRGELRRLRATDLLKAYLDWPGYREVVMVKSKGASIIGGFASLRGCVIRYGYTSSPVEGED